MKILAMALRMSVPSRYLKIENDERSRQMINKLAMMTGIALTTALCAIYTPMVANKAEKPVLKQIEIIEKIEVPIRAEHRA